MTDVSVINAVPATPAKKKFSKVPLLKALKFALPVAALAAFSLIRFLPRLRVKI